MKIYPPQTIATPLMVIRRKRVLPAPGEIFVREGEQVEPVQVIGRAMVPTEFHIVNVARSLRVTASVASERLKVGPGQQVKRGQVLAGRSCRSPIGGTVTGSGGGRVLIEAPPREVELRANLYGVVSEVLPGRGVVIRATGALIQGIWGNGKEGAGVLRVLVEDREEPLRPEMVDASCRGTVVVGGSQVDLEALERAIEIQVRGIISGGLSPELLSEAVRAPLPIIVTEGLDVVPMCSRIYRLLAANDGREAVLDAHFQSQWGVTRPEVIVPLQAEPDPDVPPDMESPLELGDTVRVTRGPHLGVVGDIVGLSAWVPTPAGDRLPAARLEAEDNGEDLLVPLLNLEVMR
ncbi:MAG: hypothetical protein PVH62_04080 [Anaerolineae bacterium]